jgi:hypothetical protein
MVQKKRIVLSSKAAYFILYIQQKKNGKNCIKIAIKRDIQKYVSWGFDSCVTHTLSATFTNMYFPRSDEIRRNKSRDNCQVTNTSMTPKLFLRKMQKRKTKKISIYTRWNETCVRECARVCWTLYKQEQESHWTARRQKSEIWQLAI